MSYPHPADSSSDDEEFASDQDEEPSSGEAPDYIKWVIPDFANAKFPLFSPVKKKKYCEAQVSLDCEKDGNVSCTVLFFNMEEGVTYEFVASIHASIPRYPSITGSNRFYSDTVADLKKHSITMSVSMKKTELANPRMGYISQDGSLLVTLVVREYGDSKKETGYIGLKNQGATCYMNSVLQSLFHLPAFRRIVYDMPTNGTEDPKTSIPLNLQRLFCEMQFRPRAVSTKALTVSFGWGDYQTFMQHDVQEFCRVLMDNLETKMKGTDMEHSIADLFRGKTRRFIRCVNVPFESSQEDEFYDLTMVVKGCKSLEESFEKYCEKERMDGDNQYQTDEYGKQDADMGVEFVEFPPVLQLHLGRFEYDFNYDMMVKINDRFEFPTVIDLSPYLAGDDKGNCEYELFGVLVHFGDVGLGHYYSFLRPTPDKEWFKFDDEWVTREDSHVAIEDNFGGRSQWGRAKSYSGYMLIYVKRSEIARIFKPISDEEVPDHLKDYMKSEDERLQALKNAKLQALKTVEVLVQDRTVLEKAAVKCIPLFSSKESVIHERLDMDMTLEELYVEIAKRLDKPVDTIRLWETNRYGYPVVPIGARDDVTLADMDHYYTGLRVFLQDKKPEDPLKVQDRHVIIYAKFFFPKAEAKLQFIDTIELPDDKTLTDAAEILNQKLGFPEGTPMIAYLELLSCKPFKIDMELSLAEQRIVTGQMVIFQLPPEVDLPTTFKLAEPEPEQEPTKEEEPEASDEETHKPKVIDADELMPREYDTVDWYLEKKLYTREIPVYDYEDNLVPLFTLKFATTMPLASVKKVLAAAAKVDFDPKKDSMLLYVKDSITDTPSLDHIYQTSVWDAVKKSGVSVKEQRLYMQVVKGVSEKQLSSMSQYTIQLALDGYHVAHTVKLLAKKMSTCGDLLNHLKEKLQIEFEGPFRFYQVYDGRPYTVYGPMTEESIMSSPFCPLRIDVVPEDQRELKENERLIEVCQYAPSRWGLRYPTPIDEPFYLKIWEGESFAETKARILPLLSEERQKEFKDLLFQRQPELKTEQRTSIKDDDQTFEVFEAGDRLYLLSKKSAVKTAYDSDAVKIFN